MFWGRQASASALSCSKEEAMTRRSYSTEASEDGLGSEQGALHAQSSGLEFFFFDFFFFPFHVYDDVVVSI
jgi:hypothetical protein